MIVIRTIVACLTLGVLISRALSKTDLLLIFILPIALALSGAMLVAGQGLTFGNVNLSVTILNIFIGLALGVVFSAPILAVDFFTAGIRSFFKYQVNSLSLVTALGFLVVICELDFFAYFFSLLFKTSALFSVNLDSANWKDVLAANFFTNLPKFGSTIFAAVIYFSLPLFATILALYLFLSFAKSALPDVVSPGAKNGLKIAFVFCALIFVFASSRVYFYDLMMQISNEVLK